DVLPTLRGSSRLNGGQRVPRVPSTEPMRARALAARVEDGRGTSLPTDSDEKQQEGGSAGRETPGVFGALFPRPMNQIVRSIAWPCVAGEGGAETGSDVDAERMREWIVTNGLGGYASGTVCGIATRRYHGLLIASLPAPLGRTMTLCQLNERVGVPGGGDE